MSKQTYFAGLVLLSVISIIAYSKMNAKRLISIDFEVYGRVQGVFFRKYTQNQSKQLGLRGWCMNTEKGTVQGNIEGEENAVKNMKIWLKTTGSPSSRIEKCEFSNEKEIKDYTHSDFKIRR